MNAPRDHFALKGAPDAPASLDQEDSQAAPLRVMTAGSVDDGKSTLIGRLMFDLGLMTDDILEDLRTASRRNGRGELDLSLFTDGLIAEREQGITIDVAYRYFRHRNRAFILCDSPGHEQYTRNMVCAASQADVALIMIDARQGPTRQSLRHLRIAQWLRVPSIVFIINKMDLAGFSRARYDEIVAGLKPLLQESGHQGQEHFEFIPVVAVDGDNIVHRHPQAAQPGERLSWYQGPTLIDLIEQSPAQAAFRVEAPLRFTVQLVLRPTGRQATDLHDFRGLAGRVESGQLRQGQEVISISDGGLQRHTRITGIHQLGQEGLIDLPLAQAGESVTITLADDLDITRGDVLADGSEAGPEPQASQQFEAQLCWMSEQPARVGQRVLVKQGARSTLGRIDAIEALLSLDEGRFVAAQGRTELQLNDLARVRLSTAQPLLADTYADLPRTGSLLLLEPNSFDTLAAGLLG